MTCPTLDEISPEGREHFMQCPECEQWFDMRSFDDTIYHCDHVHRPDSGLPPGVRVK
jgi:uncharacterized C2H2 Zn-finger protein